ncbi:MAG: DUF1232 domain-containing protein [Bdellovibrionales bacterium]|nr:DUF1232 domain-containing protein [Bdellovibrionales bacterium]
MNDKPKIEDLIREGEKPENAQKVKEEFQGYKEKNQHRLKILKELEELYDLFVSGTLKRKDKAIVIGTLLYFINPFDLIPDITPFIGFGDDMALILFVYRYLLGRAKELTKKK